ncbi:MAG: flagellar filament capping protein FliD, partial [Polymorphobacter sp.]
DMVEAFNALQSLSASLTKAADAENAAGALSGDSTARSLKQQLAAFAATPVVGGGAGRLSDIGIETTRDGSLSINTARLGVAVAADPDKVERMVVALTADGTRGTTRGALVQLRDLLGAATSSSFGSASRMTREKAQIARETTALDTRMTAFRANLVRQYTAMEVAVASFKSTQSFLDQQIKSWNNSDN